MVTRRNAERIRTLNDMFRQTFFGGTVLMTDAVSKLDGNTQQKLLIGVKKFDDFSMKNDPYREHDFGALEVDGMLFFFKIDYYDHLLQSSSPNPADPTVTARVLIIMRADEY